MRKALWLIALAVTVGLPGSGYAQWYGSTDFLLPSRSVPNDRSFQHNIVVTTTTANNVTTTTRTIGTDNLLNVDVGSVAAGRAILGYQGGYFGIEGGFMSTDTWQSHGSISDPNAQLASPFSAPGEIPNNVFDFNTFAEINYQTRLQSAEINLTYLLYDDISCQASCKFGLRALWLDEAFTYRTNNDPPTLDPTSPNVDWSLDVENQMLGPQVGLRGFTEAPGGRIGLNVLGGYAYNQIDRAQILNSVPSTFNTSEGALFGELGAEYILMPTPNLQIKIGFQFFGLSNVGLALDNPRLSNDQTDSVWYYMPYLGIGGSF